MTVTLPAEVGIDISEGIKRRNAQEEGVSDSDRVGHQHGHDQFGGSRGGEIEGGIGLVPASLADTMSV